MQSEAYALENGGRIKLYKTKPWPGWAPILCTSAALAYSQPRRKTSCNMNDRTYGHARTTRVLIWTSHKEERRFNFRDPRARGNRIYIGDAFLHGICLTITETISSFSFLELSVDTTFRLSPLPLSRQSPFITIPQPISAKKFFGCT